MNKEKYLNSIIAKYKPDQELENFQTTGQIKSLIRSWAGETLESIHIVGSYAKGTSINNFNDIDLLIILDSRTCFELQNLYENLFNFLKTENLSPFEKEISIGVIHSKISFDLIPALKSFENPDDIRIFHRKKNHCLITNIFKHIDTIKGSGLTEQIILTKIWRDINQLYFPSFYLELCVLDVLRHHKNDSLEKNFLSVLNFLSKNFIDTKIIDPANFENIISDVLTYEEKLEISQTANKSIKQASWTEIIW